ncbi:hypothetical protein EV207_10136 [Scopulibacillus darangshiensis]|uniref:DUF4025 domain-containing protein n=1 Tax=Scopulibacillus darangshiensis TaxID=442528 RepID=A0A4R2PCI2_9BACL|nr:hypothetical protein [Scopulibacillus darangshiensis]TCP32064.1 hypothetical protein EV207_10136 [Scopulibacillus darangshiensis]
MPDKKNRNTALEFDQDGESLVQQQLTEAYQSGVVDSFITDKNVFTGEPADDVDPKE